jgi:hypothetical protein
MLGHDQYLPADLCLADSSLHVQTEKGLSEDGGTRVWTLCGKYGKESRADWKSGGRCKDRRNRDGLSTAVEGKSCSPVVAVIMQQRSL